MVGGRLSIPGDHRLILLKQSGTEVPKTVQAIRGVLASTATVATEPLMRPGQLAKLSVSVAMWYRLATVITCAVPRIPIAMMAGRWSILDGSQMTSRPGQMYRRRNGSVGPRIAQAIPGVPASMEIA